MFAGAARIAVKPVSLFILANFATLVVSFWHRNDLPGRIDYVPQILESPRQTATSRKAFETVFEDVRYRVEPLFDYDLTGMIVSYRHHDGGSGMHLRANDHLNMLDVCVVWGDNTVDARLDELRFWNGIFTCNVSTGDREAWATFDMYQLSNNHLLSDDEFLRDRVSEIAVGDQIRVRGFLANYGAVGGGMRGSSTTREDTGDGACETLFVEKFEIIRSASSYWRLSMWTSLAGLLLGLLLHFRRPYRPYA